MTSDNDDQALLCRISSFVSLNKFYSLLLISAPIVCTNAHTKRLNSSGLRHRTTPSLDAKSVQKSQNLPIEISFRSCSTRRIVSAIQDTLALLVNKKPSRPMIPLTIPVSADRCCDWKNTASVSWQLGHCLFDLGSCSWSTTLAKDHEHIPPPHSQCCSPPSVLEFCPSVGSPSPPLSNPTNPLHSSSPHIKHKTSCPHKVQKSGRPTVGSEPTS